jgi:hypothetical protein
MARKQDGQIVKISGRWYVRYWERRTINGVIERKRVSHHLGPVMTRGKLGLENMRSPLPRILPYWRESHLLEVY